MPLVIRLPNKRLKIRVNPVVVGGGPTTYTLTGPSTGTAGSASSNFTATLGSGTPSGSYVITPADAASGTFSPTTVTLSSGTPSGTFTVTEALGSYTIATTNNRGLTDPSGVAYQAVTSGSLPQTQAFDGTGTGTLTSLVSSWSAKVPAGGSALIAAPTSNPAPLSGTKVLGLTAATGAGNDCLAWYNTAQFGAAVTVASCYSVSGGTTGIFACGSNLTGSTPSYYALELVSSTQVVNLIKVTAGTAVTVASTALSGTGFTNPCWIRFTLSIAPGSTTIIQGQIVVQSSQALQGLYVTQSGSQLAPQNWAIYYEDSSSPFTTGFTGCVAALGSAAQRFFDDFAIADGTTSASSVTISADQSALPTITFTAGASHPAGIARVEYYVDGVQHAIAYTAPYTWATDATTWSNGSHSVQAQAFSFASEATAGTASTNVTISNGTPLPTWSVPRSLPSMMMRQSCGNGSNFPSSVSAGAAGNDGSFEYYLLKSGVDLVATAQASAPYINGVNAAVAVSVYANFTNVYVNILQDLLNWCDANSVSREDPFWHVGAGYVSLSGTWNGTTTFTPTDGSTPASSVVVGDFVSVFSGTDTSAPYIAKVTAVAAGVNGAITLNTTSSTAFGTPPAAGTRHLRDGGYWATTTPPINQSTYDARWFWVAFLSTSGTVQTDYTAPAARNTLSIGGTGGTTYSTMGTGSGDKFYVGYADPFCELNIAVHTAASGWTFVLEYPTNLNSSTNPANWTWATAPNTTDNTSAGTVSGSITFDPVVAGAGKWVTGYPSALSNVPQPANVTRFGGGVASQPPYLLYFLRIRTTAGTAPVATTVWTRNAQSPIITPSGQSGFTPWFDSSVDADGDGYLNSTEYANASRNPSALARFSYESRNLGGTAAYGMQRLNTRGASSGLLGWSKYYVNLMQTLGYPGVSAVFSDNTSGLIPKGPIVESGTANAYIDMGSMHAAVWRDMDTRVAGQFVYGNTNGDLLASPFVSKNPACQEESFLKGMTHLWSNVQSNETLIAGRAAAASQAMIQIDSIAAPYSLCDSRNLMATVAEYYLYATPNAMLNFWGGDETSTACLGTHWCEALRADVGTPVARCQLWRFGPDPSPTVQSAIRAALLTQYTSGELTAAVTGSGPYTVTFSGTATADLTGLMTSDSTLMYPRFDQPLFKLINHGSATRNKHYFLDWNTKTSGGTPTTNSTFTLTVTTTSGGTHTTSAIAFDPAGGSTAALPTRIGTALAALSNVSSAANVAVWGSTASATGGRIVIIFQGALGLSDDPVLTVNVSGLTGTPPAATVSGSSPFTSQTITIARALAGTYTLTIPTARGSLTTAAIPSFAQASTVVNYAVFTRRYTNALVLYKPISQTSSSTTGTIDDPSSTTHALPAGNSYYPLADDNTRGSAITSISLRNGEGAILMFSP